MSSKAYVVSTVDAINGRNVETPIQNIVKFFQNDLGITFARVLLANGMFDEVPSKAIRIESN